MKQIIYKGMHFTLNRMYPIGEINRVVSIDKSCWYENPTGWNKLIGLTSWNIHQESIRIAWRPTADINKFMIAFYEYHNGERIITPLWTIYSGEEIHVIIGDGMAIVNGVGYVYDATDCKFRADFYFGGKDKSPKKMYIKNDRAIKKSDYLRYWDSVPTFRWVSSMV
jgi:hypothetical protein